MKAPPGNGKGQPPGVMFLGFVGDDLLKVNGGYFCIGVVFASWGYFCSFVM